MLSITALACLYLAASPVPSSPPPPASSVEAAQAYAKSEGIQLYFDHVRNIGNTQGYSASIIATRDGGSLMVGTRHDFPPGQYEVGKSRPVVVKLDASGKPVWEKTYPEQGFLDYEGASALENEDGYLVYILSYVHPKQGAVGRFLQLDRAGKVRWHLQLRGSGQVQTPFVLSLRRSSRGTYLLSGYIYLDKTETSYDWEGEFNRHGKLLVDRTGKVRPPPSQQVNPIPF